MASQVSGPSLPNDYRQKINGEAEKELVPKVSKEKKKHVDNSPYEPGLLNEFSHFRKTLIAALEK